MDNGEGELAQVKVEADAMFQETMENDIKPDIVKEEPRETVFFIKCEMCNENAPNEAVCAHIKNDRLGDLEHENKLPLSRVYTDTFNQDVESKMDNPEPSSSQKEDSIMKLINAEITVKEEEYYDSPEYLSTDMDLIECEIGQVKTEPIDDRSSLSSDMLAQDEDSNEDVQPGSSKESQKDYATKLTLEDGTSEEKSFKYTSCSECLSGKIHECKKSFRCKSCPNYFTCASSLARHERIHSGNKPYNCKDCCKSFSDRSNFYRHQKLHDGKKKFNCAICSEAFSMQTLLSEHKKIHAGEKPFSCKSCLKSFTRESSLILHEKIHTGVKPYNCSHCTKSFTDPSTLRKHLTIHTRERPYSCQICFKSFFQSWDLATHERTHTGEKPFHCQVCLKSFSDKSNYSRHQKIHLGIKSYHCAICAKSFSQMSGLRKHARKEEHYADFEEYKNGTLT